MASGNRVIKLSEVGNWRGFARSAKGAFARRFSGSPVRRALMAEHQPPVQTPLMVNLELTCPLGPIDSSRDHETAALPDVAAGGD